MTVNKRNLLLSLATRPSGHKHALQKDGISFAELLTVNIMVNIHSAAAIPQLLGQTKKAAATERTQQASAIANQGALYYLEGASLASVESDCSYHTETIISNTTDFKHTCKGTKTALVTKTTDVSTNVNAKDFIATITAKLGNGTFEDPAISSLQSRITLNIFSPN